MDIGSLLIGVSQSNTQVASSQTVNKMTINTSTENDSSSIEKTQNIAVDTNVGQNLNVRAYMQVDDKEEINKQKQQDISWVKNRQQMMSIKETKMLQMREIGDQAMQSKLTPQEMSKLNDRLNSLASQVSAIDSDSRRTKDGKVLE